MPPVVREGAEAGAGTAQPGEGGHRTKLQLMGVGGGSHCAHPGRTGGDGGRGCPCKFKAESTAIPMQILLQRCFWSQKSRVRVIP